MDPLFYFYFLLLRMRQSKGVAVCVCVCMWKINNVHLHYFILFPFYVTLCLLLLHFGGNYSTLCSSNSCSISLLYR